jgi:hypothetical protein
MKQDDSTMKESKAEEFYLKLYVQVKRPGWMWQAIGVVFGLVGGLVLLAFGSVFTIVGWIASSGSAGLFLGRHGTIMFLIGISLLILGAHCLDLLEGQR